jgi:opacity protein-like surface antigen
MKTIPASLLLALLAAASAAASDLSFTVGYGSARLDGGQTSASFLETKETQGNVCYFRLSLGHDFTDRVGVDGSFLVYSDLTTIHQNDYSRGIPFAIPNNRFRRSVRALALGPTIALLPAKPLTVTAGVSWVFSELRTTLDGGQEGVRTLESHGNSGYAVSLEASYAFTPRLAAGASCRYVDFGERMASSSRLTSRQADLFVALRF